MEQSHQVRRGVNASWNAMHIVEDIPTTSTESNQTEVFGGELETFTSSYTPLPGDFQIPVNANDQQNYQQSHKASNQHFWEQDTSHGFRSTVRTISGNIVSKSNYDSMNFVNPLQPALDVHHAANINIQLQQRGHVVITPPHNPDMLISPFAVGSSSVGSSSTSAPIDDATDPGHFSASTSSVDGKEKKKAQNRAAQKAFRERKEARLRELEQKLRATEENRDALLKEMEELKKQNHVINNENRLLLLRNGGAPYRHTLEAEKFTFPLNEGDVHSEEQQFKLESPDEGVVSQSQNTHGDDSLAKNGAAVQYYRNKKKLLTVPATWEYLQELSMEKEIDVYAIMQKLKGTEVCHGYGPAYTIEAIDLLVQQCSEDGF